MIFCVSLGKLFSLSRDCDNLLGLSIWIFIQFANRLEIRQFRLTASKSILDFMYRSVIFIRFDHRLRKFIGIDKYRIGKIYSVFGIRKIHRVCVSPG